ncbi:DUF456 domain-containing protein [Intrasporangium sp. DVR]|uniref:DUF456 domain-containing protein n=1 Tax=Intrasporangium sp. DVR TaxID=3127867 RepID=UPI00313A7180
MITGLNVLVLVVMIVGTVGIVVPVLPGLLLVWAATLLWAATSQSTGGWVVFGLATAIYAMGLVSQYVIPGRRMRATGVDSRILAVALVAAVVGLFVIPLVGAPIAFVGTVYLLERAKHRRHDRAWTATRHAVRAVMLNMGIELLTALLIIGTWAIGVFLTRP